MSVQKHVFFILMLLLISQQSLAHKRWLLPSIFNVSEPQWITVDASVSNNLFYVDRPWPVATVKVTNPDGSSGEIANASEGHRRSVFDVNMSLKGTYKVTTGGDAFFVQYELPAEGQGKRDLVRDRAFNFDSLKASIPEYARKVAYAKSVSRLESYMTLGAPSFEVFKNEANGIELKPETHPNDMYVNEPIKWSFLVNGKTQADLKVMVVWEGTRYRNDEAPILLKTDAKGQINFTPNRAGRFLIEVGHEMDLKDDPDFTKLYMTYMGTFEVIPQ